MHETWQLKALNLRQVHVDATQSNSTHSHALSFQEIFCLNSAALRKIHECTEAYSEIQPSVEIPAISPSAGRHLE